MLAGLSAGSMEPSERSTELSMEELAALADTAGADVAALVLQTRQTPDPRSFLGSGKLHEIKEIIDNWSSCDSDDIPDTVLTNLMRLFGVFIVIYRLLERRK